MPVEIHVPHDDFKAGFRAGWQAAHGGAEPLPPIPSQPKQLPGQSAFTMGIREAMEIALGVELDAVVYRNQR